jgi:hypothetical protein
VETGGDGKTGLAHVVAYGVRPEEWPSAWRGVLDDYVFLGHAALDAWESTGEMRYYEAAAELMESALARFYDPAGRRVLRYGEGRRGRAQAGRAGGAAEAVAGLAHTGGEPDGGAC